MTYCCQLRLIADYCIEYIRNRLYEKFSIVSNKSFCIFDSAVIECMRIDILTHHVSKKTTSCVRETYIICKKRPVKGVKETCVICELTS